MIVDSSALVAVLLAQPGHEPLLCLGDVARTDLRLAWRRLVALRK